MDVLIVHKSSNFELHGSAVSKNVTNSEKARESLKRLRLAHDDHYSTLAVLKAALQKHQIKFEEVLRGKPWPPRKFDYVITVGGDGTLLWCSQQMVDGGRIVGIRSSETSVGHLCTAGKDEIGALIESLQKGTLEFIEVTRMRVKITRVNKNEELLSVPVMNDILFTSSNPAATTRYVITVGKEHEVHKSSGVWLSTAVGSTAAIAAAGGKIMKITDTNFQYQVRELYKPPGASYKLVSGVFDPDKTSLQIENRTEHALVALDGQHHEVLLTFGDMIEVLRAPSQKIARPESLPDALSS